MRPLFHPTLANGPFGDPALYVEFLFERRALLFDLGEIPTLPPRKLLRISHAFVSHAHMDHLAGFDRLIRIRLGREPDLTLFGPAGFIERIGHKLAGYTWNLVENYPGDFTIFVNEVDARGVVRRARFRTREGFRPTDLGSTPLPGDTLLEEPLFRVRYRILDHRIPCLAFALEEERHVNVWRNRLEGMGLPAGPWLGRLKKMALANLPDETPVEIPSDPPARLPLGYLRTEVLRVVPGQKIAYVTDVVGHEENGRKIVELVRGADLLFIEAGFLAREVDHANLKYHLTARRAGELARRAGVSRVIPFHFSSRYEEQEGLLRQELEEAFRGDGRERL